MVIQLYRQCQVFSHDQRFICDDEGISEGDIPAFDMYECTRGHVANMSWRDLRIITALTQDALPVRMKSIHYLNSPPFIGKVMRLLKWLLQSEITQLMRSHLSADDTFYECLPKDMLPLEYAGKAGKFV
ncbi:hypothetical protein GQX74_007717 [Glossina fuscipes]|nr:hypothetical protein GQX74_007717 [Glossina fuscipes]